MILTFTAQIGVSVYPAFMTARFFIAGLVETGRSPPSLSADLFRHISVVFMTFAIAPFWCLESPSSMSPMVGGPTIEPTIPLGKGIEETLGEAVGRPGAAFPLLVSPVGTRNESTVDDA
jgi:hypothetical protein